MPTTDKAAVNRRIWRIAAGELSGEYVDASTARQAKSNPVEEKHPGWAESSFELKYGLDVIEPAVTRSGKVSVLTSKGTTR